MRFIFGCSGLRQSERDKRPKKLPRHTFVETFPIPTTTNVRLKKPYAQKSISISGHFHHIIFLLHYQKVVGVNPEYSVQGAHTQSVNERKEKCN